MMRYFPLFILMAVLAAGCKGDAVDPPEIEIVSSDTEFSAKGGTGRIVFHVSGKLTEPVRASSSMDWLSILEVNDSEVSFVLAPNPKLYDRHAVVTLTAGTDVETVNILQTYVSFDLEGGDSNKIEIDHWGNRVVELSYDISEGIPDYEISYDESSAGGWLHVTVAEGKVTFRADMNLSGAERYATVRLGTDLISYEVRVSQPPVISVFNYTMFGCDAGDCVSGTIMLQEKLLQEISGWSVERDSDWFDVDAVGEGIVISVEGNTTGQDRSGKVLLKDGDGKVFSHLDVRQTGFSTEYLTGAYLLNFGDGDYWLMDFIKEDGGFAAKVVGFSGTRKTEDYSLKLGYTPFGDMGPKMNIRLPQNLGTLDGRRMMLYATTPDGYYSLTENLGYELIYTDAEDDAAFDFRTEEAVYMKDFPYGFSGLLLMRGTVGEDWMEPVQGKERLRIIKWGKNNHEEFN